MNDIYDELKGLVEGEIQQDEKTLEAYSEDASLFKIKPSVVVFPKNVEDIKTVVKFVAERKKSNPELSITVRSGGTDMTGGPLTESIVLDANRHLTKFKGVTVDPSNPEVGYAIVEPGMYYRNFEKETLKKE